MPPFSLVAMTPMKGRLSFEMTAASSRQAAMVSRDFGPATETPAHWSETEVTCTFSSGQRVCSSSSSQTITLAALVVVVVIRKSLSDKRHVVPSSMTIPSSRSMMP